MIAEELRIAISGAVQKTFPGITPLEFTLERPKPEFGDFATNIAFLIAKEVKQAPVAVAHTIASVLALHVPQLIDEALATGGYINIKLNPKAVAEALQQVITAGTDYGRNNDGQDKTVVLDYSHPNIAKRMHVGHLRTTLLGAALANIYAFGSYTTVRWNYLGDWGTQFGKLIAAYKRWGNKEAVEKDPINELQTLYIHFHDEMKNDAMLETAGQEEFKKLESGDTENVQLWQWFKEESLKEFRKMYALLGVEFDAWNGESTYEKELLPLITELIDKKIGEREADGAVIVKLETQKLPPALIQKSDGGTLYLTRDIANIRHLLKEYPTLDKILYVVGNEQSLHFQQLFAVAQLFNLGRPEQFVHVKYGLVLDESGKKFATREGRVVMAEDVINEAIRLAVEVAQKKNADMSAEQCQNVAQAIAVGALKYEMLREHRTTDITFNWQRMLDFSGESGPYLQYTHARLNNIIKKAASEPAQAGDYATLEGESEQQLTKHLFGYAEALKKCRATYSVNPLTLYLYELATLSNRFYENVRVMEETDPARRRALVALVALVRNNLASGLKLLGIESPEQI